MKALVVPPDAPGTLVIGDVVDPLPLPDEALIRVSAVSLNRGEVNMTRKPRPNWRPGWDLAGVVAEAAQDGSGPKIGERVVGLVKQGAWAEQVAVPTRQLAPLPDEVSYAQAAALPVAGLTALHALWRGGFLLGRGVLITGATGGVGDYAIQLAKLAGADVTAQVRREEQVAQVREAGADNVIVGDGLQDAAQYGPFALIVDSVGGQVLADALGLVAESTRVVSFGVSAGSQVTFDAGKFFGAGMTQLYGLYLFDELQTVESGALGLARLVRFVFEGKLKPRIGLEAPWTDANAVAQKLLDRSYPGKAILHVGA